MGHCINSTKSILKELISLPVSDIGTNLFQEDYKMTNS